MPDCDVNYCVCVHARLFIFVRNLKANTYNRQPNDNYTEKPKINLLVFLAQSFSDCKIACYFSFDILENDTKQQQIPKAFILTLKMVITPNDMISRKIQAHFFMA